MRCGAGIRKGPQFEPRAWLTRFAPTSSQPRHRLVLDEADASDVEDDEEEDDDSNLSDFITDHDSDEEEGEDDEAE